jgi:hypothetical protein
MDEVAGITLNMALKLLLESVSGGLAELDYIIDDGIIVIGTKESLPRTYETLLHDVSDLVGQPANY